MRKFFTGLLIVAFMVSGCGKAPDSSKVITVWHWMADRHEILMDLANQYEEETGITVDFQLFAPSDIYSQKITAAAQARILPDIFGVLDKKSVFGEFIKTGFVENLKEDFDAEDGKWRRQFFEKAVETTMFTEGNPQGVEPGIYGVPLDVTTIQMLYNKKLLKKAGYDHPPATFQELIKQSQKIRFLGITPFVSGWSELWLIECFASNYALNIMGMDKMMATYRGDIPYTDPDWIKVFSIFQIFAQKHVVDQGIVTKSNKFAEQDFAYERAAFAFNGSWCVNVYDKMNPDLDYGVMMPPPISDDFPLLVWGGAGSSLVVNATSPNKEGAVAFLKWLTQPDQQKFLSEATNNIPASRLAVEEARIPKELSDFEKGMDSATHPTIWLEEEDVLVKEKLRKGLQSIIIGESTPEEIAQSIQTLKERQMRRKQRK